MANFTEKTKDSQLIVKAKLSINEKLDEKALDNLSRKFVRGLLKVKKISHRKVEYVGPIGVSLYEKLKKPISKYEFFFIMEQLVDMYQKLQMAELNTNHLVPDIKRIYINEVTKEVQFIYLPLLRDGQSIDWFEIMNNIIYSTKPMEEQDESYISRFTYFLQGFQYFDPQRIERYIAKEDRKVVNIIKKHNVGQSGFMTDKPRDYYEHYGNNENSENNEDDEATGLLTDDEATGLLADDEATGILKEDDSVRYAELFRILTNETIPINKPVFRLGKEKQYCDYFVSNNYAVSRSHADIITRGQQYYIMDLNSTNKTYVNGVPLVPRQEEELHEGDNIKLGNEEFIFHS